MIMSLTGAPAIGREHEIGRRQALQHVRRISTAHPPAAPGARARIFMRSAGIDPQSLGQVDFGPRAPSATRWCACRSGS